MRWRWRLRWLRLRRAGHIDRLARAHVRRFDGALVLAREVFLRVLGREDGHVSFGRYGHSCGETEQLELEDGLDLVETLLEPWAPLDLSA